LYDFFKNPDPYTHIGEGPGGMGYSKYWLDYCGYNDPEKAKALIDNCNKENAAETKEEYETRILSFLRHKIEYHKGNQSYLLVSLNSSEIKSTEHLLFQVGFEVLIPETINPGGSKITLYVHYMKPDVKQESILNKNK
jgi:hypothetical protein